MKTVIERHLLSTGASLTQNKWNEISCSSAASDILSTVCVSLSVEAND